MTNKCAVVLGPVELPHRIGLGTRQATAIVPSPAPAARLRKIRRDPRPLIVC